MFDPLGVVFRDLRLAGPFYRALLKPLGIDLTEDHSEPDGTGWLVFSTGKPEAAFFVAAGGRPTFWSDAHEAGLAVES